jgi:hypothetical protein
VFDGLSETRGPGYLIGGVRQRRPTTSHFNYFACRIDQNSVQSDFNVYVNPLRSLRLCVSSVLSRRSDHACAGSSISSSLKAAMVVNMSRAAATIRSACDAWNPAAFIRSR